MNNRLKGWRARDSKAQIASEEKEENSNNSEDRINSSKDKKYGLNVYNFKQEVKDGNYVECLVYHESGAAGLSCNWERYNQMYPLEESK